MTHTFEELKKKTVAELREIASGLNHEAVKGYTQLNKEHLLKAVCNALNIDMHQHKIVSISNKFDIKKKIKELKKKRDEYMEVRDYTELKSVRRRIHQLKRTLRKAAM